MFNLPVLRLIKIYKYDRNANGFIYLREMHININLIQSLTVIDDKLCSIIFGPNSDFYVIEFLALTDILN